MLPLPVKKCTGLLRAHLLCVANQHCHSSRGCSNWFVSFLFENLNWKREGQLVIHIKRVCLEIQLDCSESETIKNNISDILKSEYIQKEFSRSFVSSNFILSKKNRISPLNIRHNSFGI